MTGNQWYKNAIFYEVYVRGYKDSNGDGHGDLAGLTEKLDYLQYLGVDCLWLLPIYPSPLKDDGYDISDYFNIHETYGRLEDFRRLVDEAHRRGIHVIADLVLNHTSDQHPWFKAARSDPQSPYRQFYVWSDTDKRYNLARIIFMDSEPSNWTWDPIARQYYWHRFYASQPDLNYDNPAVQEAMFKVIQFWLNLGIDGFRVDAVSYLFERDETACENLPETHAYLKKIRQFLNQNYPNCILLAEVNQWPYDMRSYFGEGDEFHMAFHFPLMPRIFMALGKEDSASIRWAIDNTPAIPENCQWCNFLRNHDELTLEMVTDEERKWMWQEYAPQKPMLFNLGIRRRLAPLLKNNPLKLRLAYTLLFSLPGTPVIYYGDEIGMGDDLTQPDRNGLRTPMQWDADAPNAGFSDAPAEKLYAPLIKNPPFTSRQVNVANQIKDSQSLLQYVRHLIRIRKQNPVLADPDLEWIETETPAILAYWRGQGLNRILIIHNLSPHTKTMPIPANAILPLYDMLKDAQMTNHKGCLTLKPYQSVWIGAEKQE
jgi:maltose alpha-D-glucosyltransferase/alpha-amylase